MVNLTDVLTRLPTQRASGISDLLPHKWVTVLTSRVVGLMLVGRSIGIAMSTQPLIDDFSESLRYVITYPSHKIPVKSKIHAAVLHHESANILCISIILADRRISCELVTVPVKTHGGRLHA